MIATLPNTGEDLITVEQFLALPDDDSVDRMLIQGRLWERPMTKRNRWHSSCEAAIAHLSRSWVLSQPVPRGKVFSGEAGFILRGTPGSAVGIDVAYANCETAAKSSPKTNMIDGPPVLAVEILSPNDKHDEVNAKVREYLDVGVALVWIVDPEFRTVVVYRPTDRPQMFSGSDVLSGADHLPGFQIRAEQIFED